MEHSKEFLAIVQDAKSRIKEVNVGEAMERVKAGALLVDVREDNEWDAGHAKGAKHLGRGVIERDIIKEVPDKNTEMVLYCGGGFRSALSADNLQKMGYNNVYSMDGGWKAWKEAGGEVE
ncbi:rhodanese-like domain-containing protein [Aridibaculum aurantiacum]|uniref:rhodanese-like domain-containing protein n=1 Tax=Aridibaculum aurantiacum TaxID=2810307 RepID=UPI001A97A0B1|nr:rhodanese-like domain-containing protein [Aridibaculum aurantiacum]